jgi:hypothetical protein
VAARSGAGGTLAAMRRRVALVVGGVCVLAGLAPAGAVATGVRKAHITVKPSSGPPTTRFVIRFRAPDRTGRVGAMVRSYILSATGPAQPGCAGSPSLTLRPTRAHSRVRVTLSPKPFGGRWCPGRFHGQVEEIATPYCPAHKLCPAFVVLIGTVGKFSFRVNAPGGDTQAPAFTGLDRAFACTPGAQRPGETTPYSLSWQAATDNRTPASQLVYDIFMASTPGTENFLQPNWTTAPGATTFRTPGLPSHGIVYFVVRARDQAGNEDGNKWSALASTRVCSRLERLRWRPEATGSFGSHALGPGFQTSGT